MGIQTAFNGGVITPLLYGRGDITKYATSCRTLLNMICLALGPATRRPGLEYIDSAKYADKKAILLDFEFSIEQAYSLEFGDLYIRFYKDGARIDQTLANAAAWATSTAYVASDIVKNGGSIYRCILAHTSGDTDDEPGVGATWATYWVQEDVYEIASPYTEDDLVDLDITQSADVVYIAHPGNAPRELIRLDHDSWTLDESEFDWPPFLAQNFDTSLLIYASAVTGAVTVTASAAVFTANHVGAYWKFYEAIASKYDPWLSATVVSAASTRLNDGNVYYTSAGGTTGVRGPTHLEGDESDGGVVWTYLHSGEGYVKITGYTSSTVVTALVVRRLPDGVLTPGVYTWFEGAWSNERGFPRAVSFDANDRLWWAGSPYKPQNLWGSKVSIYTDHGISNPLRDDDALDLKLGSKKANAIRWILPARKFATGTSATEYWLTNATGTGPMTPTSKDAAVGSAEGSSGVQPVAVGNVILFLQRHGKIIHELRYELESDSNAGAELTLLAEHLTRIYGIVSMAYQKEPYKILWCVRSDGAMLGLTYYPSQEVAGWHRHETDGEVESVSVIPGTDEDEVWIVVKRTINGATQRFIERMHSTFTTDDLSDAFFVDSGLTFDDRQAVESIAYADPGVVTITAHGYLDGDTIRFRSLDKDIAAESELTSLNNEEFTVFNKTANTFELKDTESEVVDLSLYKQVDTATTGKNVTVISGLGHLEGETVTVLADGSPVADHTVTSGAITLSRGASVVHVGLGYNSDLAILPPITVDGKGQPVIGEVVRYATTTPMLDRSLGLEIGATEDDLTVVPFTDDTVPEGRPAPLFSGYIPQTSIKGAGPERENQVLFRQSQPLPLTIVVIKTGVE